MDRKFSKVDVIQMLVQSVLTIKVIISSLCLPLFSIQVAFDFHPLVLPTPQLKAVSMPHASNSSAEGSFHAPRLSKIDFAHLFLFFLFSFFPVSSIYLLMTPKCIFPLLFSLSCRSGLWEISVCLLSNTTVHPPDVKNRVVTECVSRYSAWYRIDVQIISVE